MFIGSFHYVNSIRCVAAAHLRKQCHKRGTGEKGHESTFMKVTRVRSSRYANFNNSFKSAQIILQIVIIRSDISKWYRIRFCTEADTYGGLLGAGHNSISKTIRLFNETFMFCASFYSSLPSGFVRPEYYGELDFILSRGIDCSFFHSMSKRTGALNLELMQNERNFFGNLMPFLCIHSDHGNSELSFNCEKFDENCFFFDFQQSFRHEFQKITIPSQHFQRNCDPQSKRSATESLNHRIVSLFLSRKLLIERKILLSVICLLIIKSSS